MPFHSLLTPPYISIQFISNRFQPSQIAKHQTSLSIFSFSTPPFTPSSLSRCISFPIQSIYTNLPPSELISQHLPQQSPRLMSAPQETQEQPPQELPRKAALITGITGQDGSYLAEFLIEKGYNVHGIIRRSSSFNTGRIDHLYNQYNGKQLFLHYGDLTDTSCLVHILTKVQPHEIYNLAAQSHVQVSFELPEYTADVDGVGCLRLLDAIKTAGLIEKTRYYQASTSELYGKVQEVPQTEKTPFYPRSPYGVAKQYAFWMVINYREAYKMFACNGILFNHESPRRGPTFVTRKTTMAVSRIVKGTQKTLSLGNLDAQRDWGHAKDYVVGMWKMLQTDTPTDYVLATNKTTSVRVFVEKCFKYVGIDLVWEGAAENEVGKNKETGDILVKIDPRYYRPCEVDLLIGDATKAKTELDWEPTYDLDMLVQDMMDHDLAACGQESLKW